MLCLKSILLLTITCTSTAVSQCEYVYVTEPPSGQLICDPFQINNGQLQLVCSVFANQSDILQIQWFFTERVNRQFIPVNSVLLREVRFNITPRQTYTSRIVVSSPPFGFYFCQPVLASGRQLIRSNVVPLQPPSFYQQRQIRPCLINEFQNSSVAVCAQLGVMLGPDQIIAPAPTVVETIQYVSSTIFSTMPTPTLTLTPVPPQETANPMACNGKSTITTGLIAGVVVGAVFIIALSMVIMAVILLLIQIKKKKLNSKYPRTYNSRHISNGEKYSTPAVSVIKQSDKIQEAPFVPPRKPPPKLRTNRSPRVTNHLYNRLRFPTSKMNESQLQPRSDSESSAYYITPEHNSDEMEYYVDFDEENLDKPYVDESESLIYTDSQYSTESDLHLHKQKKQQSFVRSSSLELQLDKEDTHTQAAQMMRGSRQLPRRYLKICKTSRLNRNANYNPSSRNDKSGVRNYHDNAALNGEEIIPAGELNTSYTNAKALEKNIAINN